MVGADDGCFILSIAVLVTFFFLCPGKALVFYDMSLYRCDHLRVRMFVLVVCILDMQRPYPLHVAL